MNTTLIRSAVGPAMLRPRVSAAVDPLRTCGCGQALDCWHAGHCPRCGVRVHS